MLAANPSPSFWIMATSMQIIERLQDARRGLTWITVTGFIWGVNSMRMASTFYWDWQEKRTRLWIQWYPPHMRVVTKFTSTLWPKKLTSLYDGPPFHPLHLRRGVHTMYWKLCYVSSEMHWCFYVCVIFLWLLCGYRGYPGLPVLMAGSP